MTYTKIMVLDYMARRQVDVLVVILLFLGFIIFLLVAYIYHDYRRHKRPLLQADPHVNYSVIHHVRMVTIPMLKYRISFKFERNTGVKRF